MYTKNKLKKFISILSAIAVVMPFIFPVNAIAAGSVTAFSVLLAREKASTAGNQTITFTTPTGVASGQTIILTYNNSTSVHASLTFTDIDLADDGVDVTLAAAPSGGTWGVVRTSSTVITFTNGTTAVAAGSVITIEIGTNATNQTTGVNQITNGSAGTTLLVLSGTFTDSGTAAMSITDDDQVTITASVATSISFDLDTYATATTSTETATPYTVALGTLTTAAASGSNESSINAIWLDLSTNATGGAIVSVLSANGALKSTSVPGDTIPSATATMAAGTANYGICIKRNDVTSGTFNKVAPFNGATCTTTPTGNTVGVVTTSAQTIYNSGGLPISGGRGEIMVAAENSALTPAHADYSDTLTFVATGTF